MSIVIVTGKILKVVGDFLSEPQIAKWVESQAEDFLQEVAKKIGASMAMRHAIAKKLQAAELKDLDISDAVQQEISQSLGKISQFVRKAAERINTGGPDTLKEDGIVVTAVAIPRWVVAKQFISFIKNEFKSNFQLSKYEDITQLLLTSAAESNEAEFFSSMQPNTNIGDRAYLAGKDEKYNWGDNEKVGHYYIYIGHPSFNSNVTRKTLEDLQSKISRISTIEMSKIVTQLDSVHLN